MYQNLKTSELVKSRYKSLDGEPFILTPGQNEIFDIIFYRKYPRTQVLTYTQYGKTDVCAMAVLTRITTFPEKWAIVAPSNKKAMIMMGYVIDHTFDHNAIKAQFKIGEGESLERIRRERRKDHLTFRLGEGEIGEVFIVSTEGKRVKEVIDALMGFGAPNVIFDESGLVTNLQYAGVVRMVKGHKDNFLFEIGNPFRRNHFLDTYRNPGYKHITIDVWRGLKEGRIKQSDIDEARRLAFFNVLYECKFPEEEEIDTEGWMPLWTEKDLDRAYVEKIEIFGQKKLGNDVGAGEARTVSCLRGKNAAKFTYSARSSETMAFVGKIVKTKDFEYIRPENISIDRIGPGQGAYNRLVEVCGPKIDGVAFGGKPEHEEDFVDKKAQMFWRAKEWTASGGKLVRHPGWEELLNVRYKVQSDRKIKIKPKEKMLQEGIKEMDHADAFALTFSRLETRSIKKEPYRPQWDVGRKR